MPFMSVAWCNQLTDMLNWYGRMKASGESGGGGSALESTSGLVKIKNLTGSNLQRGHYVQLGDYLLTDVEHHRHWFDGNLYDAAEDGRIAIVTRAVLGSGGSTDIVAARILGRCTARINVTDTGHRFAAPDDGSYVLKSAASGDIEILSTNKISGTGEQELAVLLGGGGGSGGGLTYFVLTEAIGAATGDTSSITPDTALAQRYATDSGTKDRTPTAASPETIYNYDTCQGWADGTAVWCFTNDAGDWEIDSAACCTLSAP